ncbi:rheb small monomeric gtpase [Moniliophthora roreri MCA 2997]|uniref:Rheb small monomeric gtpase n=2 Tax=Moniliophthora roreri TaxID=221103 RepID=V2XV44_MONRO|nr:rheb small monomeric gtpase [Moniliophthora roreri MCA 2997]
MAPAENLKKRKIAVLGSRSVGKSSLVIQFIDNQFVESYYPTIESTFAKSVKYRGAEYDCEVIDTAGQDEFSIFNSKHAIGIHGYVLVYSVTSRSSFEMVQVVYDKIIDFCGVTDIPCVIVGSKVDLESRQVSPQEGEKLAQTLRAAFIETSAKTNLNVGKVFELCLAEVEKRAPNSQTGEPQASRCIIM